MLIICNLPRRAFAQAIRFFAGIAEEPAKACPDYGSYDVIKYEDGQTVSKTVRQIPSHIALPDYALTGQVKPLMAYVPLYTKVEDIASIRAAGKLARHIMNIAAAHVKPGTTTEEIDRVVFQAIVQQGAYPSCLGYKRFPKSICTSVNNVMCHAIPNL